MGIRIIYIAFLCYLFSSCANKVTPTGGEKDVKPPVLLSSVPENKSINFKADKIELSFDEYVQLKEINQQLIVSPLMEPVPSVTVKKRTVEIDLPDTLKPNTTYTLNFGEAISDIHEGNAFPFQYIFSTGSVLDSLSLSGNASDALKKSGVKGIKVMLYSNFNDSVPLKNKPDYFALTNETGEFTINNISPGSYTAIALDDKNANYKNDSRQDEAISLPVNITVPDSNLLLLYYFAEEPAELFIKSVNSSIKSRWAIIFNKPALNSVVTQLNIAPVEFLQEWNERHDTLYIWSRDTITDTLSIVVKSPEDVTADTAHIRLSVKSSGGRGAASAPFIESHNAASLSRGDSLLFTLYLPVMETDMSKIQLFADSMRINPSISIVDSLKRRIKINSDWKENKQYRILFLPGALKDYAGKINDTLSIPFQLRNENEYGSIEVMISGLSDGNYLLQLLNDGQVVRSKKISGDGRYIFDKLATGMLKARIINDKNNNNRWDTGNYFKKQEPENVIYFPGEIQSRGNWEVETEWKIEKNKP